MTNQNSQENGLCYFEEGLKHFNEKELNVAARYFGIALGYQPNNKRIRDYFDLTISNSKKQSFSNLVVNTKQSGFGIDSFAW